MLVRWIARISSILFIGVFLLMFLGEGFDPSKVTEREWISLFFFPFGLIVGMILSWWKEGLGGAITVCCLIAEYIVGDVSASGSANMLICASPGFLFLLSWVLSKTAATPIAEDEKPPSLASIPAGKVDHGTKKARIVAGLCPKCGASVSSTDINCPSCRVNLSFAREHLDQW